MDPLSACGLRLLFLYHATSPRTWSESKPVRLRIIIIDAKILTSLRRLSGIPYSSAGSCRLLRCPAESRTVGGRRPLRLFQKQRLSLAAAQRPLSEWLGLRQAWEVFGVGEYMYCKHEQRSCSQSSSQCFVSVERCWPAVSPSLCEELVGR